MLLFRLSLSVIGLLSRLYENYKKRKYIRQGEEQANRTAKRIQNDRIKKAKNARLDSLNSDPDSLRKKDPFQRD
ncbi:MAG: hypothetical protein ACRBBN_04290 [Methyloligellaceae bacterium]